MAGGKKAGAKAVKKGGAAGKSKTGAASEARRRPARAAAAVEAPVLRSDDESSSDESERSYEAEARAWQRLGAREATLAAEASAGVLGQARDLHVDDLSSDDEDAGNATGRVPLHWYEGYDHVGYDLGGTKVVAEAPGDALDAALESQSRGGSVTVYDKLNGRNVVVTARELEQIRRMKGGAFANPESEMYGDHVDYFTSQIEAMPMSGAPEPKRRFLPSKWEAMRVARLVRGLKRGTIVTRKENEAKRLAARPDGDAAFLAFAQSMWTNDDNDDDDENRKGPMHIPAPKVALPDHDESYRPPPEYLLDDDELEDHEGFVPSTRDSLRALGAYEHAVKERFERCLDLYLCPRAFKRRLNIDPETLVPKLPDPKDLKPFPNALSRDFVGHAAPVVALSCSPDGQWLARARVRLVHSVVQARIGQGARRQRIHAAATSFERARVTRGLGTTHWRPCPFPRAAAKIRPDIFSFAGVRGRRRRPPALGGLHGPLRPRRGRRRPGPHRRRRVEPERGAPRPRRQRQGRKRVIQRRFNVGVLDSTPERNQRKASTLRVRPER